jgi:extracellular elastinolytic metalloproteinase
LPLLRDGTLLAPPPLRKFISLIELRCRSIENYSPVTSLFYSGNNVVAYKSSQSSTTSQSATGLVFDYTYNTSQAPSTTLNVNAARTNAFYIINSIHDVAYRYGFTEAAFNFQTNNFGKGGSGNDRVLMSVQDSSGTNNANFATPPEYVFPCALFAVRYGC